MIDDLIAQNQRKEKGGEIGLGHTLEEIPEEASNPSGASSMEDPNVRSRFSAGGEGSTSLTSSSGERTMLPHARALPSGRQVLSRGKVSFLFFWAGGVWGEGGLMGD